MSYRTEARGNKILDVWSLGGCKSESTMTDPTLDLHHQRHVSQNLHVNVIKDPSSVL